MTLLDRITLAEALSKEGVLLPEIMRQTGLTRITAQCIRSRVTGQVNFDGLRKNRKDD